LHEESTWLVKDTPMAKLMVLRSQFEMERDFDAACR